MNVATALNKKYVDYTIVMLYSLAKNQDEDVCAYLLHSELEEKDKNRIAYGLKECTNIKLEYLEIDKNRFSDQLPQNDFWSLETYYRLMLLDLLPSSMERVLYLDVDIIVNGSLSDFYHMNLEGYELVSCENINGDFGIEQMSGTRLKLMRPMMESGYRYFNAGVVLFHLSDLRGKYDFSYYMNVAEEIWDYEMEAPDQDLLNYVHSKKVGYVDDVIYDLFSRKAYNNSVTVDEIRKQVKIIHYAGDKPWNTTNCHYDNEIIWWEYAKETPIYYDLLEKFMIQSISDTRLEKEMESLINENTHLKDELQRIMNLLKKIP